MSAERGAGKSDIIPPPRLLKTGNKCGKKVNIPITNMKIKSGFKLYYST
jgi:hypothetical protein